MLELRVEIGLEVRLRLGRTRRIRHAASKLQVRLREVTLSIRERDSKFIEHALASPRGVGEGVGHLRRATARRRGADLSRWCSGDTDRR